ncbi:hypothetical protein Pfeifenkraut_BL30063 [Xanthomonas phage Pfeifenkraut]|uniref:Uncharacterized protein n=1 Tax=Xanthomonas phage Pfeifenkraut TaxID=2939132 RepID=A0A9E7E375_9CAUD|nr:hypothetical protein QAY91_gp63 [Xanthomonas phage Pfeifenkraut]URA06960.1 hypothetical protein Pfeifenkraut_BL30063 [Xanthomonas phage Pfeifenkraut]
MITDVRRHIAARACRLRVITIIESDERSTVRCDDRCFDYLFRTRHGLALAIAASHDL